LSQVENELKTIKEEVMVAKKEARKKEEAPKKAAEAKRPKETTKDMMARLWKDGHQGCSEDAPLKM
jgi:regulator of replication initiation timing